jgi:glycosyltransferase involved in cell wall biosynthesis
MSPEKSTVIPNSILFSRLQKAPLVPFKAKYGVRGEYLLHVGRFAKQKCIDFLVRNHACSEAKDLSLVLIGQDDGEMQGVSQLINAAGLSDRVHVIERIDHDELCAAYREASALVMASRNEGLPTVILEAAIFGTPVIAPRVGGIPFIIEEGVNGYLYEWGDRLGYLDLVRQVISGKLRVQEVSKRRVIERYSWEVNAGRVKSLYEELIREQKPAVN